MFITMMDTRYGSEDAFSVKRFIKDHVYDVTDSLADHLIRTHGARNATLEEITEYMNSKLRKVG